MSVWFDSRDVRYKDPFGAVSCGAEVRFALGADEPLEECCLLVRQEFAGLEQEVPLFFSGDGWCGVLTAPAEPELIWYAFRVRRTDGSLLWLGRNGCGGEADRQRWQLTVYEPTHTPDWFGRGVTYQIFPDRFCRLAVPDGHGMVGQRLVHQRWDDTPQWRPDKAGEIRNNDYFGGSLLGIISKLDYLQSLSVSTLYLSHCRGGQQSPLQHRRLPPHRPHAGDGGGLPPAVPGGPPAGHPGAAGRRIQPHRQQQPLLQRRRLLPGAGGGPESGFSLFRLVQLPSVAHGLRCVVGRKDSACGERGVAHLSGLHCAESGLRGAALAAARGRRLATGCGGRAAR